LTELPNIAWRIIIDQFIAQLTTSTFFNMKYWYFIDNLYRVINIKKICELGTKHTSEFVIPSKLNIFQRIPLDICEEIKIKIL